MPRARQVLRGKGLGEAVHLDFFVLLICRSILCNVRTFILSQICFFKTGCHYHRTCIGCD